MKDWFCKNLGDATLAADSQARLQQVLRSMFARAGSPTDMAAFLGHESEGRLHCEVKVYLSPSSVEAAHEIGAERCARPSRHGLSLLAGGQECWQILFVDQDQ